MPELNSSYNLGFISDQNIFAHVMETVKKYRFNINLKSFNANLIDPIKLTFDAKIYNKSFQEIIESEVLRQLDKSNTNHIGYFHQNIFKYFGGGWEVPDRGFDVTNEEQSIFVELKNKHNTMNSSSSQKTYMRMQSVLIQNTNAKCYLVEVIAKKSQNIMWNMSLDGVSVSDERIRRVSIDKFYEIITGDKLAFKKLCEKLPLIISDAVKNLTGSVITNSVFEELKELSPLLVESIYLLSFKKYEGFDKLEFD